MTIVNRWIQAILKFYPFCPPFLTLTIYVVNMFSDYGKIYFIYIYFSLSVTWNMLVFFLVLVHLVSSANIIDCIYKTEILLKVALNTNNPNPMIEKFKDIKGFIKSSNSKKDNTMIKRKRTNNELQNTIHKTKDWVTRAPLKNRGELACFWSVNSFCSTSGTCRGTIV